MNYKLIAMRGGTLLLGATETLSDVQTVLNILPSHLKEDFLITITNARQHRFPVTTLYSFYEFFRQPTYYRSHPSFFDATLKLILDDLPARDAQLFRFYCRIRSFTHYIIPLDMGLNLSNWAASEIDPDNRFRLSSQLSFIGIMGLVFGYLIHQIPFIGTTFIDTFTTPFNPTLSFTHRSHPSPAKLTQLINSVMDSFSPENRDVISQTLLNTVVILLISSPRLRSQKWHTLMFLMLCLMTQCIMMNPSFMESKS